MSMRDISRLMNVNGGLYGGRGEAEGRLSLPAQGPLNRQTLLSLEGEPAGRTVAYRYIGSELGALFRAPTVRSLLY